MTLRSAAGSAPPEWGAAAAAAAAARHRERRLHPDRRSVEVGRRLLHASVVLWAVAAVLTVIGLAAPADAGDVVGLVGSGFLLAYLAVAFFWGIRTGRYLVRGDKESIRTALPPGAWPDVRRQLAGRTAIDPDVHDVVIESAHQQHRLLGEQVAFVGFYVLLCSGLIGHGEQDWFNLALLVIASVALLWSLAAGIRTDRRLVRVIKAGRETAAS